MVRLHCHQITNIFILLKTMQRRDSLGSTTKIPRLSKGSTRKFKTRRSQTSFSSASDAFAEDESTRGQPDLSVSEMKLRSEKNLDGNQGRSAEAGPASETLVDPFDEGERTLIRPDFEPDEVPERESRGQRRPRSVPRSNLGRKCCTGECPNQRLRAINGERNLHIRQVHTHLWPSRATTR